MVVQLAVALKRQFRSAGRRIVGAMRKATPQQLTPSDAPQALEPNWCQPSNAITISTQRI
jgi:hypothetical protein